MIQPLNHNKGFLNGCKILLLSVRFFSMNVHHPSVLGVALIPKKSPEKCFEFQGQSTVFSTYCTGEYYYACSSHSIVEVAKLVLFPNVVVRSIPPLEKKLLHKTVSPTNALFGTAAKAAVLVQNA